MRAFNLMPREGENEQKAASAGIARIALALLGILVVAGLAGGYMLMGGRVGEKQSRADDLRAQLAEVTAQAPNQGDGGATTAALAGQGQARTAALADALSSRVAWDRILREFALVVPEGVWLTTLSSGTGAAADGAAAAPASFTIAGAAESHESVALLLSRLSVLPEFASVQLQSSARGGGEEGAEGEGAAPESGPTTYSFSIVATLTPGGVVTP
jgi:Tfp pilus assembly protein PilN